MTPQAQTVILPLISQGALTPVVAFILDPPPSP